jgi:hypothetical protein
MLFEFLQQTPELPFKRGLARFSQAFPQAPSPNLHP